MNLSKSKFCNGVQCNKILWLDKYKSEFKEEIDNKNVLDNGTEVGIFAQKLFGPSKNVSFNSDLNKMIDETNNYLKEDNVIITEASFNYEGNFCSVDILKKERNQIYLYEVKSSTQISDIYIYDISYQYYVLKKLGFNIKKVFIVYINSNYIRHGELELNKLFNIKDVTDKAIDNLDYIESKIEEINNYMLQKDEPIKDIGLYCFKPYECPYFKYCSKHLPRNNVFDIRGMTINNKVNLYNKGIISFKELLNYDINEKYKEQIDFELNQKKEKIINDKIMSFINTITYPLYFLDFETFQESIPKYDDTYPYMQIPFQYSLHIMESKSSDIKHVEFLARGDCDPRRDLAISLINNIPKDVCVLAYNMSFEKSVIKALAHTFPDLSEHLMNIYNNIKDLMIPFKNRDYYNKEMKGSYSIKYVLPALFPDDPSLNYKNLEMVHNGSEASSTYQNLGKYSKEELENVRKNMLKYCELDTFAMVKIWQKINEIKEEK